MSCGEFDVIARYFNRSGVRRRDVRLGIGDDCALLQLPTEQMLAVSTDTLVAGTHFLPAIDPADLAYKSLAVNLSDLAAMGAKPAWLSLALTLPEVDNHWLHAFSDGLFQGLERYDMQLIGGDTTKGPLALTLTIFGLLPIGRSLLRSGAATGDWIYVSGTLGDSAAGLTLLQGKSLQEKPAQEKLAVEDRQQQAYLLQRHLRPDPRLIIGQAILDLASSAIDLSDGLVSDLGHILKASGCGACIDLEKLPLSQALCNQVPDQQQRWRYALAGGEDYELCFSVGENKRQLMEQVLQRQGQTYTCIGQMTAKRGELRLRHQGQPVHFDAHGFDHFRRQP